MNNSQPNFYLKLKSLLRQKNYLFLKDKFFNQNLAILVSIVLLDRSKSCKNTLFFKIALKHLEPSTPILFPNFVN